jgi:hypothetical protein
MKALPIAIAVFAAAVLLPEPASSATEQRVALTQSTWYWKAQVSGVAVPGSPPETVPDPTVPANDLAVGGPEQNGQPPSETYVEFDTTALPLGATITSFVLTLPVDSKGTNAVPTGMAPPIIACLPQESWSGGPGGQPYAQKPADSCAANAPRLISKDKGKTYTADIASIAQQWLSSGGFNFGVAITDDPHNTSTAYQVVFGPASALSHLQAEVSYIPPAASPGLSTSPAVPPPAGPVAPTAPAASATGTAASPVPSASSAPAATGPALASPTSPARTGRSSQSTGAKASSPSGAASSVPPIGFWIAGILLALLVAACWIELGGPPIAPSAGRLRGVGRLLSQMAIDHRSPKSSGAQLPSKPELLSKEV